MNELKIDVIKTKQKVEGLKATIKFYYISKIRGYFKEWREESERKSVVKNNSEDGLVAVENHNLRK
jgi:hypothetical protein